MVEIQLVRILSKKSNIPFYVIPVSTQQKNSGDAVPFEVGPSEFVSLIRNAEYVVTDSFHGMAFSVNYNIPFIFCEKSFGTGAKSVFIWWCGA